MTIKPVVFIVAILASGLNALAGSEFQPGQVWLDTEGQPIRASSAGILRRGDVYYLYGADMGSSRRSSVMCYSSKGLYNWKLEGVAFDATHLPPEMERGFVERPKVIFNEKTGKYVMWMHLDQRGYHYSRAGVAVSDKPTGPFTFLKAIRPITEDTGFKADDPDRQKELGTRPHRQDARGPGTVQAQRQISPDHLRLHGLGAQRGRLGDSEQRAGAVGNAWQPVCRPRGTNDLRSAEQVRAAGRRAAGMFHLHGRPLGSATVGGISTDMVAAADRN